MSMNEPYHAWFPWVGKLTTATDLQNVLLICEVILYAWVEPLYRE